MTSVLRWRFAATCALTVGLLFALIAAQATAQAASYRVEEASVAQLQADMAAGRITSEALVRAYLARIQAVDVVLPSADLARELRLRCVVRPDTAQRQLLDRLGLRLPERLQPPGT